MSGWKEAVETRPEMYDGYNIRNGIIVAAVSIAFIGTMVAMWANYSGILRYLIVVLTVSFVMLIPANLLFQESARSVIREPEKERREIKGEFNEISRLLDRALAGYNASQILLEDRLRDIMLEKISIKRRMSVEEARERTAFFDGAKELVKDDELAVLLSKRKRLGSNRRIFFVRPSKKYAEHVRRIVKKMEEWN